MIENLESRLLASITLQNFEVRCDGRTATHDDFGFKLTGTVLTVTHRKRFDGQLFETKSFNIASFSAIRVNLGVGDDRSAVISGSLPITRLFIVDGGTGNDTIGTGEGGDIINGGSGNDGIFSNGGSDLVHGGLGNDAISGGPGSDNLSGDGGNDTIKGEDGNDKIFGNDGNDTIFVGPGTDQIDGGAGDDTFVGLNNPSDTGGGGIVGNGSSNGTILAGSGNDGVIINGRSGADNIHISRRVTPAGAVLEVNHSGFKWSLLYVGGETVTVLAGRGNDLVTMAPSASAWKARFFGQGGNDLLIGTSHNDLLDGGEGTNLLLGNGGFDELLNGIPA